MHPARYSMQDLHSSKASLDVNHSHFILVDNGTTGKYGVDIGLRSEIEGTIRKKMKTVSDADEGKYNM